jgi:hypothetical protein
LTFCKIFRSLSRELHDAALAQAAAALAAPGALADRLRAAVEAKSLRFVEIAYGSPHGSELLDASNRLCGDLPVQSERRFLALVTGVLRRAARACEIDLQGAGLRAPHAAELFVHAVSGLKGPGVTVDAYRARVAALVRIFVAGLGAGPPSRRRPRTHRPTTPAAPAGAS